MSSSTQQQPQTTQKSSKSTNQKSLVILDIKPTDQKVDLKKLKQTIDKQITMSGLIWGQYKIQQIGYGISKLVHTLVITNQVSVDDVVQNIQKLEGVQDVDIVTFQKV